MAAVTAGSGTSLTSAMISPPSPSVFIARRSFRHSSVTQQHQRLQVPAAASAKVANNPPSSSGIPSRRVVQKRLRPEQDRYKEGDENKEMHSSWTSAGEVLIDGSTSTDGVLSEYLRVSNELMLRSKADGGPPRWFCYRHPVVGPMPTAEAPVLLFLPGLCGVGSGLLLQMNGLREMFNVWCLHIPFSDTTPFTELVKLVEETVRRESSRKPRAPVYLVAESFGACIALAVASRNPHLHLILILANPATSFGRSQVQALLPLSETMAFLSPEQRNPALLYFLSSLSGLPSTMGMINVINQTFGQLPQPQNSASFSSYLSVISDLLSAKTLSWKMKLLKSGAEYANSRLHAVKARTLILSSGRDALLPSEEEARRLGELLPNCEIRRFSNSGHLLFLEDEFDMATVIKGAGFYQRGTIHDYVSDYLPPKPSEFNRIYGPHRWMEVACNPVMLSRVGEDGTKIVRGLSGIPSEGPVLLVGYHMLLGMELIPLVARFWMERRLVLRGVAHPLAFRKLKQGRLPEVSTYDVFRSMGAVPVSASNLFKLFASKSHVLLYPGGMREALHRKGEEHKLIWPEQSEFVRMAARFGATIVPFGAVGEDDFGQVVYDYDDLIKIPYFKSAIQELTQEAETLRSGVEGEVGNQDIHLPIIAPKLPGRLYFLFGNPIQTQGRKQELKNREAAQKLYQQVKSEVEWNIAYLKQKREKDPYRSLVARLGYHARHGLHTEVPTFDL